MATKSVTATISTKGDMYYVVVSYYEKQKGAEKEKRIQKWVKTDLTVSGHNKRKIEAKRIAVLEEWREKLNYRDSDILFSDFMLDWLEATRITISNETYYSYKSTVENVICPYFRGLGIKLCDLRAEHIQAFYSWKMNNPAKSVSANTIYHYHANIHKALAYAYKNERIKCNPADLVELPKKEKHIANYYGLDECKAIIDYAKDSPIEVVVFLAAWFGLRRGEIIGLKWEAVDFQSKTLSVVGTMSAWGEHGPTLEATHYKATAKNSKSLRTFPMSDAAAKYLRKLKEHQESLQQHRPNYNHAWDGFVCVKPNGDLISLEYVTKAFPKMTERAGMKRLKLHELRHTNVSLLLNSGMNYKDLADWAGHSDVSTTMNIYAHLAVENKKRMTNALSQMLG